VGLGFELGLGVEVETEIEDETGYARNGSDDNRAEWNPNQAIAKTDDEGGGWGDENEEVRDVDEVEDGDVDG
jgi:hypothetical protein